MIAAMASTALLKPVGTVMALDGVNEFVNLGNVLPFERTATRSWVFWLYRSAATGGYVFCRQGPGPSFGWAVICEATGAITLDLLNTPTTNELTVTTTTSVPLNVWTHVAVTYDGSSSPSGCKFYFNSVEQPTDTVADTLTDTLLGGAPSLIFGAHNSSGVAPLPCLLARMGVYSVEISQAQVTTVYGGHVFQDLLSIGPTSDLIGYWPVQASDSASNLEDTSTGAHHGNPNNMEAGDFVTVPAHALRI